MNAPQRPPTPVTNRLFGSLGLFLLRVVTFVVVGVRGLQVVTDISGTRAQLVKLDITSPEISAWVVGVVLLVSATMILFGFGTRIAGALIAAVAIAVLSLVRWGNFNLFNEGQNGLMGDFELLLAGVGILLLTLGAGGWSIDAGIMRRRLKKKYGR